MFADCTANFTIKQYDPPTLSCSANPTTVQPGGTATITAQGVSPQNRPLTYTFSASAGQISGSGNTATLSTAGAPAGSITITCTCRTTRVRRLLARLRSMWKRRRHRRLPRPRRFARSTSIGIRSVPARVDNEAKACLDDVALNLQQQTDATAVVVGEAASD
jgi:hypothetical protein